MPAAVSIPELQKQLNEQKRQLDTLKAKRSTLEKQLACLDRDIAALEGTKDGATRSRLAGSKGAPELARLVPEALRASAKPLRMREIADTVIAMGYPTSSSNFPNVVAQYVYKDDNIVRVARGQYTLKEKLGAAAVSDTGAPANDGTHKKAPARRKRAGSKKK